MSRSNDKLYIRWKKYVVNRDRRCLACDSTKKLRAHHINSWKYFISLRYLVSNGATLCNDCHIRFHTDFKSNYTEICTTKDFVNFIRLSRYFLSK